MIMAFLWAGQLQGQRLMIREFLIEQLIWIVRKAGDSYQVLLQKRSANKESLNCTVLIPEIRYLWLWIL